MRRHAALIGLMLGTLLGGIPGMVGSAVGQEPIKIGWIGPLSGWGAPGGTAILRGSQLAIDHVNAAGGIDGRKLVLVTRDSEATPAKAVTVARELIDR